MLEAALREIGVKKGVTIFMKTKALIFINCLAAGALIASPVLGKPVKKSTDSSVSKSKHTSPQTTHVTPSYHHQQNRQNVSSRASTTGYYAGKRYTGTRSYAGRQYSGTRYYRSTPYYRANTYYGGTRYYYGGGSYPYYSYYTGWPYSNWGYGTSWGNYPYSSYSYWGGYPSSYYNNYYSYYTPTYGHNASLVVAVQRRLGQLGYYHGVVDGVVGPQTSGAIAAFESRNGLVVDGRISRPLIDTLGLG
jgi:hypothetical protein